MQVGGPPGVAGQHHPGEPLVVLAAVVAAPPQCYLVAGLADREHLGAERGVEPVHHQLGVRPHPGPKGDEVLLGHQRVEHVQQVGGGQLVGVPDHQGPHARVDHLLERLVAEPAPGVALG